MAYAFPVDLPRDLTPGQRRAVLSDAKVTDWLDRIESGFTGGGYACSGVTIRDVVFGGPRQDKLIFALANAAITNPDGQTVPGAALLRGGSVCILPVLDTDPPSKNGPFTVLTHQTRVPAGARDLAELPAGMVDGDLVSAKAMEELVEEVGPELQLSHDQLLPLGEYLVSPGGTDETMTLYAARMTVSPETLAALQGRRAGLAAENESIRTEVLPLAEAARRLRHDMKSTLALTTYALAADHRLLHHLQFDQMRRLSAERGQYAQLKGETVRQQTAEDPHPAPHRR